MISPKRIKCIYAGVLMFFACFCLPDLTAADMHVDLKAELKTPPSGLVPVGRRSGNSIKQTLFPESSLYCRKDSGGGSFGALHVNLVTASEKLRKDINESQSELQEVRAAIAKERQSLLSELESKKKAVAEAGQELARLEADRHEQVLHRDQLVAREAELAQFQQNVNSLVRESRRSVNTFVSLAERQLYEPEFQQIDQALSENKPFQAIIALLSWSTSHTHSSFGGYSFEGTASGKSGDLIQGTYAQAGPLCYFLSAENEVLAGLAYQEPNSLRPAVFSDFESGSAESGIRKMMQGDRAKVPVDVTTGTALRLRNSGESWVQHLKQGGFVMIPLLALASFCLVVAVYKLISLHFIGSRNAQTQIAEILRALNHEQTAEAEEKAMQLRRPLGPVILQGIRHRFQNRDFIEELMHERLLTQIPALECLLSPLAVGASVAPLLGLLGTVTGMIHTFRAIQLFGSGNAALLSGGISEALVTTEVGLAIAIPALLVHAYLARRVRKAVATTQQAAVTFVNGLKLKGDSASLATEPEQ